jgi:hypothetical protein
MATELSPTETSNRGPLPVALASIILRLTKEAADARFACCFPPSEP